MISKNCLNLRKSYAIHMNILFGILANSVSELVYFPLSLVQLYIMVLTACLHTKFLDAPTQIFQLPLRSVIAISIWGSVRPSVRPSDRPSVRPSIRYASSNITEMTHRVARLGLFITAPARPSFRIKSKTIGTFRQSYISRSSWKKWSLNLAFVFCKLFITKRFVIERK